LVSVLATQLVHEVLPASVPRLANVLTGHGAHASPRPSEIVPGGQAKHWNDELALVPAVYVPAGQLVQVLLPAVGLNVLTGHTAMGPSYTVSVETRINSCMDNGRAS
jgi:hypothetical protein